MPQLHLKTLDGRVYRKNISKYLIKWNSDSPSKMQFNVKQFLKKRWLSHMVYEEFPVFGTRMRVDFLNLTKNIAVEVNGKQHSEFNKFFHKNSREVYGEHIARDIKKYRWLKINNFQLIEIEVEDMDLLSVEYIKEKFEIDI